jgi:hypothetical protein
VGDERAETYLRLRAEAELRRAGAELRRLDAVARRSRAAHEGWLGEVEGLDLTLTFLCQKREQTQRLSRIAPINLGMPGFRPAGSS